MRIVHFSDWHGQMLRLPYADLYVCTGDMLPNDDADDVVDQAHEAEFQTQHLQAQGHGNWRKLMANPTAPVVCCRGNHDYVDLAPMFGGDVYEITDDPTRTFCISSLTVGGVRGVPYYTGKWADEFYPDELANRFARLPGEIDLLVTHTPPLGILDHLNGAHIGSPDLLAYVARHNPNLKPLQLHCFGHVHPAKDVDRCGETLFSNAATGWNMIDL